MNVGFQERYLLALEGRVYNKMFSARQQNGSLGGNRRLADLVNLEVFHILHMEMQINTVSLTQLVYSIGEISHAVVQNHCVRQIQ